MIKRIDRSRSIIAATVILAVSTLYLTLSILNEPSFDHDEDYYFDTDGRRHLLQSSPSSNTGGAFLSATGHGPELAGTSGHVYKFHGTPPEEGITWYNVLSSPRLQWNMAPYTWKGCPHMFLGNTGFTFHEPDPNSPTKIKSRYMRFRLERRDDRSCLWNYSKTCLAGGNFIMNFGKTARDILHPGDYTLKTSGGNIRVVAFNTNRACSRRWPNSPVANDGNEGGRAQEGLLRGSNQTSSSGSSPITPLDYLRQAKSSVMDPEACEKFITLRELKDDLFAVNADFATIIVDTPWMQIIIQVRQNKVATATECNYAKMDIWITNMISEVTEGATLGVLGKNKLMSTVGERAAAAGMPSYKYRALSYKEGQAVHEVDGPFGTTQAKKYSRESSSVTAAAIDTEEEAPAMPKPSKDKEAPAMPQPSREGGSKNEEEAPAKPLLPENIW